MLKKLRKSSSRVTLVLIGLAGLTGCGGDERRDVYASREDCLADWGNKPEDCTPATGSRHAGRGFFYGPSFTHGSSGWGWGRGSSSTSSSRSSASSRSSSHSSGSPGSTSRGGFGSSGHSSTS
jgi:hypothetical protein